MKISDFDYELPQESIAIYPPKIRGKSRLLVLNKKSGEIQHKNYSDLFEYLNPGDVLILNDTKVIKARLDGTKSTGGKVELIVLEEHGNQESHKIVMYHGKLKVDDQIDVLGYKLKVVEILGNGLAKIHSEVDLYTIAEKNGQVPIPPYLNRDQEEIDKERYQTVFAKNKGSIAAPTASLNFTEEIKKKLEEKGVEICYLTLHVGLGTFLPIRSDNIEVHNMHSEYYIIPETTISKIINAKKTSKNIAALGTTVTRTLEHAQDKIFDLDRVGDITGEANIFIYPGYEFKVIDKLITNFHAPRSTVLMLAAAFADWCNLKNAYEIAQKNDYKFLSYGDSMLIM